MSIHSLNSGAKGAPVEVCVPDTKTGDPVKVIGTDDPVKPKRSIKLHNVWGATRDGTQTIIEVVTHNTLSPASSVHIRTKLPIPDVQRAFTDTNQRLGQAGLEPFDIPVVAEESNNTRLAKRIISFGKRFGFV